MHIDRIGDVFNIISNIKHAVDLTTGKTDGSNLNFAYATNPRLGSIKAKARDSVFQFPVLMSNSLSKDTMFMVSKALERVYANYIKIAISNSDLIDIENTLSKNGKTEFLKRFHQNDTPDINFKYMHESFNPSVLRNVIHMESIKLLTPYCENYNTGSLSHYNVIKEESKVQGKIPQLNEATATPPANGTQYTDYERRQQQVNDANERRQQQINDANERRQQQIEDERNRRQYERNQRVDQIRNTVTISDTLIRKNNEMEPTILDLTVKYKTNNIIQDTNLVIGIKCVVHGLPSNELCYFIPKSIIDNRLIFKLIRWTSGEIKFWKDVIFDFDNLKYLATKSKESGKWWKYLKDKSQVARINNTIGKNNTLLPNTSMVINYGEYEYIKNKHGIDLLKKDINLANKLMDIYFLLGLLIVDESTETVYSFDDQRGMWEMYSFDTLQKDNDKLKSSDLKALVSLIK